jgi:hypothetical protein
MSTGSPSVIDPIEQVSGGASGLLSEFVKTYLGVHDAIIQNNTTARKNNRVIFIFALSIRSCEKFG